MAGFEQHLRSISAQRLPMAVALRPGPRPLSGALQPDAAFVAQVIAVPPRSASGADADAAYRTTSQSATRRMPPGYRASRSV